MAEQHKIRMAWHAVKATARFIKYLPLAAGLMFTQISCNTQQGVGKMGGDDSLKVVPRKENIASKDSKDKKEPKKLTDLKPIPLVKPDSAKSDGLIQKSYEEAKPKKLTR